MFKDKGGTSDFALKPSLEIKRLKNTVVSQGEAIQVIGHQPEKEVSLMAWVKDHEDKLIQCKSVIDTGNTLYSTGAISEKFHKKLQVGFKKKRIRTVGTAKKGAAMTDLGVSKAIEVIFEGI